MLQLILPEESYWESLKNGLNEIKAALSPFDLKSIFKPLDFQSFADYKAYLENKRLGINLPENRVPETLLWIVDDKFFFRHLCC